MDETSENLWGYDPIYMAQEGRCLQSIKDYADRRIPLGDCLKECFLLVYDCARLDGSPGSWSMEVADEAALVLTRHWRQFVEAIPDLKRCVLSYDKADIRTRKQQLVIESRWRKALDMICGYDHDYGYFEPALIAPFFEKEQGSEAAEPET